MLAFFVKMKNNYYKDVIFDYTDYTIDKHFSIFYKHALFSFIA